MGSCAQIHLATYLTAHAQPLLRIDCMDTMVMATSESGNEILRIRYQTDFSIARAGGCWHRICNDAKGLMSVYVVSSLVSHYSSFPLANSSSSQLVGSLHPGPLALFSVRCQAYSDEFATAGSLEESSVFSGRSIRKRGEGRTVTRCVAMRQILKVADSFGDGAPWPPYLRQVHVL